MAKISRRKRGGQPKYVLGRNGRPIVGLSYDKTLNQYYSTHHRPKKYFGSDLDQAVVKFRTWQSGQDTRTLVALPNPPSTGERVRLGSVPEPPDEMSSEEFEAYLSEPGQVFTDPDGLYDWARAEIQADPAKFAERVGIPQIAWLDELEPPGPGLTLEKVGELYFGKRKKVSDHWRRKQESYWKEFRKCVRKRNLKGIKQPDIARYHDTIWNEYEKANRSPTYISHRVQAVRTILRHALKAGQDQRQVSRVLDLCATFETPVKKGTDPRPIGREDFQQLLDVSSPKWRAVLLVALNCAFYPSEVAAVRSEHMDLNAGTLVMDRGKTGVPRIAMLWSRTVRAIRAYQTADPHQSDYVFVSQNGQPYNANHLGRNFRRRRDAAGLDESVTFDTIRDGAYSAAVGGGATIDEARLLAGHRVSGVADHYLKRNPKMAAAACSAIEKAYFD